MIKYFTVENFRSIKTENILEFDGNLETNSIFAAHPVIGFAGANASGKTTILQSLSFVFWFMQNSFLHLEEDAEIPCEPFYSLKAAPTKFHLIFAKNALVAGKHKVVEYEYQLEVTQEKVLMEELYYHSPDETPQLAYLRQENEVKFGDSISPIDTKDLRPNCSLISFAAQFASQEVAKICKAYEIQSNVTYKGWKGVESQAEEYLFSADWIKRILKTELLENKEFGEELGKFLKIADVGIEEVYIIKEPNSSIKTVSGNLSKLFVKGHSTKKLAKNSPLNRLFFKHRIDHELADFYSEKESVGTVQFLLLLYKMLYTLQEGGVLVLDEIKLKLHQNLVAYLIGLFQNPSENPQGAQLIFSFHNSSLSNLVERPNQKLEHRVRRNIPPPFHLARKMRSP